MAGNTFKNLNITNKKFDIESNYKNIKIIDKIYLVLIGEKSLINSKNKINSQIKNNLNTPTKEKKYLKFTENINSISLKFISAKKICLKKSSNC